MQHEHVQCGLGPTMVFLFALMLGVAAVAGAIALLIERFTRRRRSTSHSISLLAAERLAARANRIGLVLVIPSLIGGIAVQATFAEPFVFTMLFAILALYGAIERLSAACVLRRLRHAGATAELRGTTLVVTAATGRTWLEVSRRAIRELDSMIVPRAVSA